MRAASLLLGLLSLTACGADALDLVFRVPARFEGAVASVQVRLLRPPAGATFGCEALAFGEVSEDAIRLSLDRQLGVGSEERVPLVDVDRSARKIFLADGLAADGRVLTRGCLELGEVAGPTEGLIEGAPVPVLELVSAATVAVDLGDAKTFSVEARLVDRLGRPLDGVRVRWDEVTVEGRAESGGAESEKDGRVRLEAAVPPRPGPFRVELRARWGEGAGAAVAGFVRPPPESATLSGLASDYRAGRVGPSGEPGFAVLLDAGPGVSRVARVYRGPSGALVEATTEPIRGDSPILGLLVRPGERADRPIVLTEDAWWEVEPTGALTERTGYRPPGLPRSEPRRVLAFNPCDGSDPELLVIYGAGLAVVHDAMGERVTSFQEPLDVVAAGCVENELGSGSRLMVVAQPNLRYQLVVEVSPTLYWVRSWLALTDGVSISPALPGQGALLIGSQLDVNDVVVSRAAVRADDQRFELATRATDHPPEVPIFTQGGDLDGDGVLDLVSLVRRFRPGADGPYALWAVHGAEPAGRRLAADADLVGGPGATAFVDPQLLLVDLDGDGLDDVVVGERTAGGARPSQIVVYSMGLLAP